MAAKNVGIRRSDGEFILCTNIDIIFSDKMYAFLAKENLKKRALDFSPNQIIKKYLGLIDS